ncbi:unnamed protein product [Effrenium voratum]|nr:unnamed protein product [Effrenium voratum]
MANRYQPADAAGRFKAQPAQEEASPNEAFDFEELETDPSERQPGGALARRLWAASAEVRQWKWISVGLLFMLAMLAQSLALYFATRRYVRWVSSLSSSEEPLMQKRSLELLTMRLLQPRDTISEMLGQEEAVSKLPLDLVLSLIPLVWLVAVVQARNLRLWTRTLLAASFLATLAGLLACLTMLPDPLGWQSCQANLQQDALDHYQGELNFAEVVKAAGLILWLWVQDLVLGMRLQGQLVCAGGASVSGPCWFSALFAFALYDLSRMWSRKLKPHFRDISHLACGGLLAAMILMDAGIDVATERQYTAGVTIAMVLALLVYQSPALAVCTDRLLTRGTPHPSAAASGDAAPTREASDRLLVKEDDTSRDLGDVVVPPCCIPFCGFHGRYFLYSQPASAYEQELQANARAQAELDQLQKEQELTTRRLLELEGQLEALHARQAKRALEEPMDFERQLQARLAQARQAFELEAAKLQEDTEKAQREKLRLQEEAEAFSRKEELLSTSKPSVRRPEIPGMRTLPPAAWAAIYARFPHATKELSAPKSSASSEMGMRTLPPAAWAAIHARFAEATKEPSSAPAVPAVPTAVPLGMAMSVPVQAKMMLPEAGDFRVLPEDAWQKLHQRFEKAQSPRRRPAVNVTGDHRAIPQEAWQKIHAAFQSTRSMPSTPATALPALPPLPAPTPSTRSIHSNPMDRAHMRPSATPSHCFRLKPK